MNILSLLLYYQNVYFFERNKRGERERDSKSLHLLIHSSNILDGYLGLGQAKTRSWTFNPNLPHEWQELK